jgi:diguanylate cyclase (GGDEF)-like protein
VSTILIVDDDEAIRDYLAVTLELAGLEIVLARDGAQALELARRRRADLVLLDVMMPGMDGLTTLAHLQGDPRTRHLPVVLLSARSEREDAIAGLEAGADDYLTKPFEPDELLARVRAALRRTDHQRLRNPLSGLPGNEAIQAELTRRVAAKTPLALLHVDLDGFKAYNDHYGFVRGDEALRAVAALLLELQDGFADERAFVGHVGGDDFVVLCDPKDAEVTARAICERFDRLAPTLYDAVDREAGIIRVTDRQGVHRHFPLLSVSIGVASSARYTFRHPSEVASIAAELKTYAKARTAGGSSYVIDRRRGTRQLDALIGPDDAGGSIDAALDDVAADAALDDVAADAALDDHPGPN